MSYRITIDGDPFCTSNFEDSQILNPKVTLEVNKSGSLVFTMLPGHPYYDKIEFRQSLFDVYLNDELIFEGIPVSESTDFFNRKTVTCEGELTFLNDTIQRQAVYQNQTVQTLLGAYLSVHNAQADATKQFTVGSVTVDGGNSIYRYTNYNTTMQEIQDDLVQNFGGYFRVRHSGGVRYLDYLDSSPHTSSQTIRIGKNLVDLSTNLSSLDICTVLIPLGAKTGNQLIDGLDERLDIKSVNGNLDYLVGTAQAYFGNVWKTKVWDDVTTASALKTKGQDYLDDVQWNNLVISATAFDLGLADDAVEQFHVLDMIRVVSEPHGIDRNFLLSKLDIDLDHPANTKITLGQDLRLSLSARAAQLGQIVERQPTQIMVNASENARQILDSATDGAIQILFNSDGVAYELRINNSQDPDSATKWWRYNVGGWGFTADGGQTYTTAATNDGTIFATLIKSGILSSDNEKYWLNLDTGEMKMNSGEIGGWAVDSTHLYKTSPVTTHQFTSVDSERMWATVNGQLDEATVLASYPYYDLDGDGHITAFDCRLAMCMMLGIIPNGTITSSTAQLNSGRPYGSLTSLYATGQGFIGGAFGVFGTTVLGNDAVFGMTTSSDKKVAIFGNSGNVQLSDSGNNNSLELSYTNGITFNNGGTFVYLKPIVVNTW